MGSIGEAAQRLPASVAATHELTPSERGPALRTLLLDGVHGPVMEATAHSDDRPTEELEQLAAAVRAAVPEGAEAALEARERVFLTLLRSGALEPAWSLAHDNGSGAVAQRTSFSTSSGAARSSVRLPLVTLVEGERVYAWLPGFRDPRWAMPDSVYELTDEIAVHSRLDQVRIDEGRIRLSGWAYLTHLPAQCDDEIRVVLSGPNGASVPVAGLRARRAELVKGSGPDLTRLAWSGWSAELAARTLDLGEWSVTLQVGRGALQRSAPVGPERGPLAAPARVGAGYEVAGRMVRPGTDATGGLTLRVQSRRPLARVLPRVVRRTVRAAAGRR